MDFKKKEERGRLKIASAVRGEGRPRRKETQSGDHAAKRKIQKAAHGETKRKGYRQGEQRRQKTAKALKARKFLKNREWQEERGKKEQYPGKIEGIQRNAMKSGLRSTKEKRGNAAENRRGQLTRAAAVCYNTYRKAKRKAPRKFFQEKDGFPFSFPKKLRQNGLKAENLQLFGL